MEPILVLGNISLNVAGLVHLGWTYSDIEVTCYFEPLFKWVINLRLLDKVHHVYILFLLIE